MKKIVFTLAAMMSMTLAFANDEASAKVTASVTEAEKYEMNINVKSLARALNLNYDEVDAVNAITGDFSADMKKASEADGMEREKLYKKAIKRNLSYMHAVLDYPQYAKY